MTNPSDVQAAERRARSIADTEAMRWVDMGLRYLSDLLADQARSGPASVPSIVTARVGRCGLEISVSPPVGAPLGWFSPVGDGTRLVLDPELSLEELEALAGDHWPAWPALVSVGESDGCEVLLNLEHAGSVSVEGPPKLVDALLGQFALELGTQPWSDEMLSGLYLLGDCPLSADLDLGHRVASGDAERLAHKLSLVSGAHRQLVGGLCLSALRAIACEALPNVAVAFSGTPVQALQSLAAAAVPESSGVALAGAGPFPGARWTVTLTADGDCRLRGNVRGRSVSFGLRASTRPEALLLLARAFKETFQVFEPNNSSAGAASVPAQEGESLGGDISSQSGLPEELDGRGPEQDPFESRPQQDVPPLGDRRTWEGADVAADVREGLALLSRQPPEMGDAEICILGPVDVRGGDSGALGPSRRTAALAVLAYVAAHERPVSADELASALWPLDTSKDNLGGPQRKTVMNVISRARALVGYGPGGRERLAHSAQGYQLTSDVTCDWSRFGKLVSMARSQAPPEAALLLRAALELVRGEPFSGFLSSQFFEWVASEHLDLAISAKVVDAAEELGQLYLNAGDLDAVTWAVGKGLQLDPAREELFRLWMHALGQAGRPANVDEVYRRLRLILQRRIHPLQEPQPESREVWRTYTAAEVPGI
jgi:DNA-binding SARP family transcriptional activator